LTRFGPAGILLSIVILLLVGVSQTYWFLHAWRLGGKIKFRFVGGVIRAGVMLVCGLLVAVLLVDIPLWRSQTMYRDIRVTALAGLWLSSALCAFLAVQLVEAVAWVWRKLPGRKATAGEPLDAGRPSAQTREAAPSGPSARIDIPRRHFLRTASVLAGAIPFAGATYGYAFERLRFEVNHIELALPNLAAALEGMRVVQLSDLHMSSYFSPDDARRAVDMANDLNADVAVVTGDFITRAGDPLERCVIELSRLRAPLGVWGCNGNHEIYAGVEAQAARLFRQHGMQLLRQESVELVHHAQPFNLIGVDYQRNRGPNARVPMLREIETLVRHDIPNILLSHNPNTFPRAAQLGIELTLSGHTHGGQVNVEILDHGVNPAQFFTRYVAGAYRRPLGAAASLADELAWADAADSSAAAIYVNRGLGTIGAPVRIGSPPEITHFTLRRA
jgi:predicted MPP superfamily phosphohydrolase